VFELNGQRREVTIHDATWGAARESVVMADPDNPMDIGSGIPGMISELNVSKGDKVKKNDVIAIIEAMKMETAVLSKADGIIDTVFVKKMQTIKAGELIVRMKAE
jgi:pyruvate carboxylase